MGRNEVIYPYLADLVERDLAARGSWVSLARFGKANAVVPDLERWHVTCRRCLRQWDFGNVLLSKCPGCDFGEEDPAPAGHETKGGGNKL